MSRYSTDTGFVLSRQEFGEYDRVIKLFTLEKGRFDAVARGVRKPASKLASRLEPFHEISLRFAQGSRLPVIIGAEIITPTQFSLDLDHLWCAHGLLEITEKTFTDSETGETWYDFMSQALPAIFGESAQIVWLMALARSLDQLGLTPSLPQVSTAGLHHFQIESGTFANTGGIPLSERSLKLWQLSRGQSLASLEKIRDIRTEVVALSEVLERFWLYQTGFSLKCRQLMS